MEHQTHANHDADNDGFADNRSVKNRSNRGPAKRDLSDATAGERLQKVLAKAGVASRRACEELVASGEVEVNGEPVLSLPAWVNPEVDQIRVSGKLIDAPERKIYVMLYKPRHTVSTVDDPEGRRTVLDIVEHPSGVRLYPVGRLDTDTMGLLLMTNDGELANRLTHPRYGVHKTYRAIIKGHIGAEELDKLGKGVFLADRRDGQTIGGSRTAGVHIEIVRAEPSRTHIDITLQEGRNRQIRRMLAQIGRPVKKLTRVKMGPVELKGLRLGEWRELNKNEVGALRKAARQGERQGERQGAQKSDGRAGQTTDKKSGKSAGGRSAGDTPRPGSPTSHHGGSTLPTSRRRRARRGH